MARLRDVVFDAAHPPSLARFWAAALDGYDVAPYGPDDDPEFDPTVLVERADGGRPRLWFQLVAEAAAGKVGKNRVHLDVDADDRAAEVARLVALGATVHEVHQEWTTLLDPEGNELCVFGPAPPVSPPAPPTTTGARSAR